MEQMSLYSNKLYISVTTSRSSALSMNMLLKVNGALSLKVSYQSIDYLINHLLQPIFFSQILTQLNRLIA